MAGDSVAQDQIKAFVDRILRLKEETKAINADIREIYAEAKGNGFDKTVLGKLVSYVEKRQADPSGVSEGEAIFDLYLAAYYGVGTLVATHTHEASGHDADGVFHDDETPEPQPETAVQMQPVEADSEPAKDGPATSVAGQEGIADQHPIFVANTLGDAGFIDPIGYEIATNSQPTPSVATGEHVPTLTVLSRTHTLETANENADVRAHDAPHVEDDSAAVDGAPLTTDSQANAGGENDLTDYRSGNIENTMKGDGPSEASVSDVEIVAPLYAEPGEVVMETCPPVGIVVHPYAACWPVNTVGVGDGIREPVVKIGHLILDGRGRYFAARQSHVEYPVVQYDGDDDLADSIGWNLASRPGMDPRGLRIVAEKLAKLVPDRAEEIMERFGFNEAQQAAQ